MTWQNALKDAAVQLAQIYEHIREVCHREKIAPPKTVRLALYPTAHDYRYFRGSDPWSWEYHTEVARAVKRLAARDAVGMGVEVELHDCTAAGCAAWCEERGLVADTKNRAMYVSFLSKK